MIRLLCDHQIFSSFRRSGISRYFCELFREFPEYGVSWKVSAKFSNNEFLQELETISGFFPDTFFRGRDRILERINRHFTLRTLKKGDFDVFHSTYSKPYRRDQVGLHPYVITVHDMTHEHFPELPSAAREAAEERESIANADAIITPSRATADDLATLYPEAKPKISVIYHGVRFVPEELPERLPEKFVICVGTRKFYRDFPTAVKIVSRFPDLHLLCVGGGKFDATEEKLFAQNDMTHRVSQRDLSDGELAGTYRRASALIFPSRAEGFGLPVIEAAARGCVPILSDVPVFREIGGDGALYFPAGDVDAGAEVLREVLLGGTMIEKIRENGLNGIGRFDWKESARRHAEVYAALLGRR